MNAVRFYDTTLRDGEQMPGVTFTLDDRVRIATALDRARIDEIEIGFAATGAHQRSQMRAVVDQALEARTLSLSRLRKEDVDLALEVGVNGVILFVGASSRHLASNVRSTFDVVRRSCREIVEYARERGLFVQLSLEDAFRTPMPDVISLCRDAASAGADRIGLADTVGCASPHSVRSLFASVRETIELPLAGHFHNDFGLAVANSLAAVEGGAAVLSTTVNGIGERSGNAPTEVCAAALVLLLERRVNIDLHQLAGVSALVAEITGVDVAPNHPIVGANSFRHESGIHVAAVLRDPTCYEPFDPARVGRERELVVGGTSGRAALRHAAARLGVELTDTECRELLVKIRELAESGVEVDHKLAEVIDAWRSEQHS